MGENQMMNLFEQAIEKKELLDFALGKHEYFIVDRDYGEHSVISSWLNYILPLIDIKGIDYVNKGIESMFIKIIENNEITEQVKNESLLYHLHTYYYLDSENRLKAMPLNNLNKLIENIFTTYTNKLIEANDIKIGAFNNAVNLIKSRGGLAIQI
jgi:hypothetical protein